MKNMIWFMIAVLWVAIGQSRTIAAPGDSDIQTKSFTVSKGGKLQVDIGVGDIRVHAWEKNEVKVEVEGIDEKDVNRLKMTQSGNNVFVKYRPNWGWFGGWSKESVRFDINVPSQFDLELETSGGDIELSGSLTGSFNGQTSGGDIRINDDIAGRVEAKTSGGDIQTKKIQDNATLKTSGGNIQVGAVSGEAEVITSGGDIKIESTKKKLIAKTAGGDIVVGDVGGEATISTAGGDVKVGKVSGTASLSTAGGNIELRGASGSVSAKTAGGDINLDDVSGSVEAKTAGGDVRVELIPSGKGKSKLASAGGDVNLFLPENAKATIEARIQVHGWWGDHDSEYKIYSDFKADSYESDKDTDEIRAKYTLNGGGENISLQTVNANIEIKKLKK